MLWVDHNLVFASTVGTPLDHRYVRGGPLMLVYLTDVRGDRVVLIQVSWIG